MIDATQEQITQEEAQAQTTQEQTIQEQAQTQTTQEQTIQEEKVTKKRNLDNEEKKRYAETLQNINNLSVTNLKKVIAKAQSILEKEETKALEKQKMLDLRKENIRLVNQFLQEKGIKGLKIS